MMSGPEELTEKFRSVTVAPSSTATGQRPSPVSSSPSESSCANETVTSESGIASVEPSSTSAVMSFPSASLTKKTQLVPDGPRSSNVFPGAQKSPSP